MTCVAALLLAAFATVNGLSFDRYSAKFTVEGDSTTGRVGVDYRSRGHLTQGRAGIVLISDQSQIRTSSYILFNATMQIALSQTGAARCLTYTFNQQLDWMLDFSSRGWLSSSTTQQNPLPNGGTQFVSGVVAAGVLYMSSAGVVSTTYNPTVVSLNVDQNGTPTSLNVSSAPQPIGDLLVMQFSGFSTSISMFQDREFGPPDDICIEGPPGLLCKNAPVQTIDIYRTHSNDTYATELYQQNAADPTGEAYYLSTLTPHSFISHFRVTLKPQWSPYQECNSGTCVCYVATIPQNYQAFISAMTGVGREEGLGGVVRMDGTGQCDPTGTNSPQGYWYSFTLAGRCNPGDKVGTRNCTWTEQRVKTITLACAQALMTGATAAQQGVQMVSAFTSCPRQHMTPGP